MKNKKNTQESIEQCYGRNYKTVVGIHRTTLKFIPQKRQICRLDHQYACTCYLPDLYTGINQNSMKQQLFAELAQNGSDTVTSAGATQWLKLDKSA